MGGGIANRTKSRLCFSQLPQKAFSIIQHSFRVGDRDRRCVEKKAGVLCILHTFCRITTHDERVEIFLGCSFVIELFANLP